MQSCVFYLGPVQSMNQKAYSQTYPVYTWIPSEEFMLSLDDIRYYVSVDIQIVFKCNEIQN